MGCTNTDIFVLTLAEHTTVHVAHPCNCCILPALELVAKDCGTCPHQEVAQYHSQRDYTVAWSTVDVAVVMAGTL